MRANLYKPIAIISATTALAGAPVEAKATDVPIGVSGQVAMSTDSYDACAQSVLQDEMTTVGHAVDYKYNTYNKSKQARASIELTSSQVGSIATTNGLCIGTESVDTKISLAIRDNVFQIPGPRTSVTFTNETLTPTSGVEAYSTATFSYTKVCLIARTLRRNRHTPKVKLGIQETRSYEQPGLAKVTATSDFIPLDGASLPCPEPTSRSKNPPLGTVGDGNYHAGD